MQISVKIAETTIEFGTLPNYALFVYQGAGGEQKIRQKIDNNYCVGVGKAPVPMLMRSHAKVRRLSLPEVVQEVDNVDAVNRVVTYHESLTSGMARVRKK